MKGEIWTRAMHSQVDARKLDELGRDILRKALEWERRFRSKTLPHENAQVELLDAITKYRDEIVGMVLEEEKLS